MATASRFAVAQAQAAPTAQASEDSPPLHSQDYFAGVVAVSWMVGESSARVCVDE